MIFDRSSINGMFIFLFFLFGCSNETPPKKSPEKHLLEEKVEQDTLSEVIPDSTVETLNFTDANGWKQGKWITKGYRGKVVRIETFRNDTLNGYWFDWRGGQEEGTYVNGKKHGYFRSFYGDKSEQSVLQLKFYQRDSVLWFGFPAASSKMALPIKPFHTYVDSVFIKAPHCNGALWYKGLFVQNTPVGKHYIYDERQRLLATANYTDSTVQFTKYADEDFINSSKIRSSGWKLLNET